jgi:hypothetical protein
VGAGPSSLRAALSPKGARARFPSGWVAARALPPVADRRYSLALSPEAYVLTHRSFRITAGAGLSQVLIDHLDDRVLGRSPHHLLLHLPIFEKQQGRNAADVIPEGDVLIVVDIQFSNHRSTGKLLGDVFDGWGHHAARRAPRRPEIYQHRLARLQHLVFKISFTKFKQIVSCHWYSSSHFFLSKLDVCDVTVVLGWYPA